MMRWRRQGLTGVFPANTEEAALVTGPAVLATDCAGAATMGATGADVVTGALLGRAMPDKTLLLE